MPKKYRHPSFNVKPQNSAPSHLRTEAPARVTALDQEQQQDQEHDDGASVNELISRSRHANTITSPASISSLQHTTASSLPPSIRAILDMADIPAPRPREGAARVAGPGRTRRIPGPPPPPSWLQASIHAPRPTTCHVSTHYHAINRVQKLRSNLPGLQLPSTGSLRHQSLKALAVSWMWQVRYSAEDLAFIPTELKEELLSYIGLYGEVSPADSLSVLFPTVYGTWEDAASDDCHDVKRLDLSNAVTSRTRMSHVAKRLLAPKTSKAQTEAASIRDGDVPDDWDAADSDDGNSIVSFLGRTSLTTPLRFPNLRHLSLALRPENTDLAMWTDLITFAPHLSTLSSLSLAFWPRPTLTPRASRTHVTVKSHLASSLPGVTYGGTNMYSTFDGDWKEPAGILRSLSRSLSSLQWLDLTGCADWLDALIWAQQEQAKAYPDHEHAFDTANSLQGPAVSELDFDSQRVPYRSTGPEWNGSWRNVDHICLDVGWTPAGAELDSPRKFKPTISADDAAKIDRHYGFPAGQTAQQRSLVNAGPTWDINEERERYYHRKEIERYMEAWRKSRSVAEQLQAIRKRGRGKWIQFDLGDRL